VTRHRADDRKQRIGMSVDVPGVVLAIGFLAAAVVARLLPDPPPARTIMDKYLHVPSTFPTQIANKGLHRPMTGAQSGMSPGMRPYSVAGTLPRRSNTSTLARSLAIWSVVFLVLALVGPG